MIFAVSPIAFSFFGIDIYWYSLSYIFTFLIGDFLIKNMVKKNNLPFSQKNLDNLFILIVLGVVFGGRLGYFLFYDFYNFTEFLNIRNGGMSFHGGFLGVVFSVLFYSFYYKKNCLIIADLIASITPIGLFLGRIANYLNDEILGSIFFNWDYVVLYESFFEGFVLFLILNFYFNDFEKKGKKFYLFLFFYSLFRIFLDFFKERVLVLFFFDIGQILSIFMLLIAVFFLYFFN
ncbi:prolipoprotein diacylglyceryl transferase [Alphaproteobacteria bacterium endosymbiont of Tiliacea citrago]|uniref:prolipoprotein diacylglyceryl transferase n=1 Tax=Alphaproteobacteria bacterium endosymbiont of Tiliacea citrago TaxID=3077944 RepID=UPI00313D3CAC